MVPIASKIAPFNDRPSTSVRPQEKKCTHSTNTHKACDFVPAKPHAVPTPHYPISKNRGTTPISLRGAHFGKVPHRHTKKGVNLSLFLTRIPRKKNIHTLKWPVCQGGPALQSA